MRRPVPLRLRMTGLPNVAILDIRKNQMETVELYNLAILGLA